MRLEAQQAVYRGPFGKTLTEVERNQAALCAEVSARACEVDLASMFTPTRGRAPFAAARMVAIYLFHVTFQNDLTTSGAAFGRDRYAARHAMRVIEQRRDNIRYDRWISRLEITALIVWKKRKREADAAEVV